MWNSYFNVFLILYARVPSLLGGRQCYFVQTTVYSRRACASSFVLGRTQAFYCLQYHSAPHEYSIQQCACQNFCATSCTQQRYRWRTGLCLHKFLDIQERCLHKHTVYEKHIKAFKMECYIMKDAWIWWSYWEQCCSSSEAVLQFDYQAKICLHPSFVSEGSVSTLHCEMCFSSRRRRSEQAVVRWQKRPVGEYRSAVVHHSTGQSRLLNPGSFLRSQ